MERELLARYHCEGDVAARDELVERCMPLAHKLARRYMHGSEPLEDLVQVATVGLLKAVDRFDVDRPCRFSSYAVPTILGELKRYFRDKTWAVHLPRDLQERLLRVRHATDELSGRLGRSPTPAEVAGETGDDVEGVLEAMEAATVAEPQSMDAQLGGEGEESATSYAETLGIEEEAYDLICYRSAIAENVKTLPPRDQVILHLRFVEDLTQQEIAERVGISQMHVSRLLRRSLARLGAADAA